MYTEAKGRVEHNCSGMQRDYTEYVDINKVLQLSKFIRDGRVGQ